MNNQGRPPITHLAIILLAITCFSDFTLNYDSIYLSIFVLNLMGYFATNIIIKLLIFLLLYKIWSGYQWARLITAILIATQTFFYMQYAFFITSDMADLAKLPILQTSIHILYVIGTILLFTPASNAWFKAMSVKLKSTPDKD